MIQNAFTGEPKPKPKTLAQQQSDFTAEGAPPAGLAKPPQPTATPRVSGRKAANHRA